MKLRPWIGPWVAAAALGGSVLSCASAAAQPTTSPSSSTPVAQRTPLAAFLDEAWQRSPEAAEAQSRRQRAAAEQSVAANWLASALALELSQRNGRNGASGSSRETEVGVALPLWRYGQRHFQTAAAEAELAWAMAAENSARLKLAGQLREAAGGLWAAEAEVQQAQAQESLLVQLSDDVGRRVTAGELAPADALAARAELLAARSQTSAARQRLQGRLAANARRILNAGLGGAAPECTAHSRRKTG